MHAWFVLAFKFDMVAQIKFQRTHVWPTKCCYLNIGLVDSLRAGLMNSPARGRLALQLGWSCTAVVVDPTNFNSIVAIWSQTNG